MTNPGILTNVSGIHRAVRAGTVAVVLASLGLACSSSDDELLEATATSVEATTSASTAEPTTTAEATTSTVSSAEQEEAAAKAEIEEVVTSWLTFPYDSAKGEDGLPLEHVTGLLRERILGNLQQLEQDGQIRRSRGNDQVDVLSIELDAAGGTAEVKTCGVGDNEFVDAATGEVVLTDDPRPSVATVMMTLTDDGWKAADFFATLATENPEFCTLT